MNRCPEGPRVQDYLDRALEPGAVQAFRAHLATCASCAAELALYRRVFDALAATPTWDPGPALTERVLTAVLPSRVRRHRRLFALGWGYAGALAATLTAAPGGGTRPCPAPAPHALIAAATPRVQSPPAF